MIVKSLISHAATGLQIIKGFFYDNGVGFLSDMNKIHVLHCVIKTWVYLSLNKENKTKKCHGCY